MSASIQRAIEIRETPDLERSARIIRSMIEKMEERHVHDDFFRKLSVRLVSIEAELQKRTG
jgi:hypothetical protein